MQQDYDSSASGYLTDSFEEIGISLGFLQFSAKVDMRTVPWFRHPLF